MFKGTFNATFYTGTVLLLLLLFFPLQQPVLSFAIGCIESTESHAVVNPES